MARDESEPSKRDYMPHQSDAERGPTRERDPSDRDKGRRTSLRMGAVAGLMIFLLALLVGIIFMLQH
ncbi:hypothetical protein NZD89_22240 [Alicyclobacillus fastidiosus]|uniref:Uncharacterized protein n=1 Tax=Alicyclobacillus fastidiosus TaxID=392011 RepID=A0ABY6ZFT6_9BACL|nr:hypothetical protein [Alicyclobacillus fastidiosus]WAH40979.1 hypothetical protein NZD89_22240 [Alicyclobacillus fastidiosus]